MRRRLVLVAAMVVGLATITAPVAAAADPARPFLGVAGGTGTIVPATAACPLGSMFFVEDNGTGQFAHLGRVHYTLDQCAALDWATGAGWTTKNGSMTIIAANGDRLFLSYNMTFQATPLPIPTTADAHLDWVVAGGTGRFAAATGSGEASYKVYYTPDLTGGVTSSVWWGTISY